MIATPKSEMQEVLSRVANWPAADRVVLARKILESAEARPQQSARGLSADDVIAQLKMPQPAPGDVECQRIVEDELLRKYGR